MHANVRLGVIVSTAALSAAVSSVHAQLIVKGDWSNLNTVLSSTGNTAGTGTFATYSTSGATDEVGQAKVSVTVTHTGGTNQSQREQRDTVTQTFTLSGNAIVQVPRYFNGDTTFFGGAGNLTNALYIGGWTITNTTTNTVVKQWGTSSLLQAANGNDTVNTADLDTVALPAGNYKIDVSVASSSYTRPTPSDSPPAGTGSTQDFQSGLRGASTNIEAWPANSWDSRSAVAAPSGRANYGVTGAGVEVGLIEVGRPYRTGLGGGDNGDWSGAHPSLAGRLFIPAGVYAEEIKTKYRDEHAQQVASIVGSNDANSANAGIAPGAFITTHSLLADPGATNTAAFRNALDSLTGLGMRVINFSGSSFNTRNGNDPAGDNLYLDQKLNANPNLVFVKSSGNNQQSVTPGTTAPGTAYNCIAVGGIGMNYRRSSFSSFGNATLNPFKPDIVAPAEYINSAAAFGGGFNRASTGEAFDVNNANTGEVSGTSFAAPHVSGAVALLDEYYDLHQADHDQNAKVMKAVLLNSATTGNVFRGGGGAWAQVTANDPGDGHLIVQRSLDPEIGAGLLNVNRALQQYATGEVRVADGNTDPNFKINVGDTPFWWDHEQAVANSDVDYLLTPGLSFLRGTLTWNGKNDGTVDNMSLRLYYEGNTANNEAGYDPANPADDTLVAETRTRFAGSDQNVALINMSIGEVPFVDPFDLQNIDYGRYYLAVFDQSGNNVDFGLAVSYVPEPTVMSLSVLLLPLLTRRRRTA